MNKQKYTNNLFDEYPDATFCISKDKQWVQIGDSKYTQVELDRNSCQYRVWLWGNWYYIKI